MPPSMKTPKSSMLEWLLSMKTLKRFFHFDFRSFREGVLGWGDAYALELLADFLGGALEAMSEG